MKKYRFAFLATGMLAASLTVSAQTAGFLNFPDDARALGMGGTAMGLDAEAGTVMTNPAAMPLSGYKFSAGIGYLNWQPAGSANSQFSAAAFATFGERFSVSVYGKYLTKPTYDILDNSGNLLLGGFRPTEFLAGAGFAFRIIDNLSVGVNAKFIGSSLSSPEYVEGYRNGTAFAADVTASYRISSFLVSAGVTGLGTDMQYSTSAEAAGYRLPAAARIGAGYGASFGDYSVKASAEFDYYLFHSGMGAGIGAEVGYLNTGFLRAGYHYATAVTPSYASVGAGAAFYGISLNAAYLIPTGSELMKNTFQVSLNWSF